LAERYLKEIRSIHDISGRDIRFHPKVWTHKSEAVKYRPAFLSIARDKDNQVQALEAVYLDEKTAQKAVMNIKSKKSFGIKKYACVVIYPGQGNDAVTYITEGVKTGLSIRDAVKNERVIATLGKSNFKTLDSTMLTDKVVFCADNDGKSIACDAVIIEAVTRLRDLGKTVEVIAPKNQGDFNEVAKITGVRGVVDAMKNIIHVANNEMALDAKIDYGRVKEAWKTMSNEQIREVMADKTMPLSQGKSLMHIEREIY
jgi:hypothetical protein